MTPDDFRRIALGMLGAIEASHMNHPDFRANGRIFATIAPDHRRGMVALTPEQQEEFLRTHPGMFEPAAGAWGRGGATMVRFEAADPDVVGEAMTLAWQRIMTAARPKMTRKPAGTKSSTTRKPAARNKPARKKPAARKKPVAGNTSVARKKPAPARQVARKKPAAAGRGRLKGGSR